MISAEDKTKTKMDVARQVFAEVVNCETMNGITKLLFLNKQDLFKKKLANKTQFQEFRKAFPDYSGGNNADTAADFVADKFRVRCNDCCDTVHHHVICALDTSAIEVVFEAVKEDIFVRIMSNMNAPLH